VDDIRVLKAIVKQYNEGATTIEVDDTLHSRIIQLDPDAKRTRKTVFLNEEVSSQLDGFSKRNRVNNSDIVELAVMDFIERYRN
jgi:predicted transcriptional regulator